VPKNLYWTRLTCWSQIGGLFKISSSEITMLFLAYSLDYVQGRRMRYPSAISGSWSKPSIPSKTPFLQ
jgi:hypothetical protein